MKRPSPISRLPSPAALAAFLAFVILHSSFVIAQPATGTLLIPIKTATGSDEVELAPTANQMLRTDSSGGLVLSTDGSFLTALNASNISTGSLALARLAQGGATTGQVLTWTGSAWAAQTPTPGVQLGDANTWTATQTFSGTSGGKIVDFKDGVTSMAWVQTDGTLRATGWRDWQNQSQLLGTQLNVRSNFEIRWSDDGTDFGTKDLSVGRIGAGQFGVHNGSSPAELHIYNDKTSGTNYERGFIGMRDDVFMFGTEAGPGGGTAMNFGFYYGGTFQFGNSGDGLLTGRIRMGASAPGSSTNVIMDASASNVLLLWAGNAAQGSTLEFEEMTAPSAPNANRARLYLDDNGSGKSRLMIRFSSGAAKQIEIED